MTSVSLCVDFSLSSAHQTHDIRNVITLLPIHLNLEHFLDHQWTTLNSAKFDSNLCQYNCSTNHHLLFWNVITHIVTVSTCLIITTTHDMAYKGRYNKVCINILFFLLTTLCSMIQNSRAFLSKFHLQKRPSDMILFFPVLHY